MPVHRGCTRTENQEQNASFHTHPSQAVDFAARTENQGGTWEKREIFRVLGHCGWGGLWGGFRAGRGSGSPCSITGPTAAQGWALAQQLPGRFWAGIQDLNSAAQHVPEQGMSPGPTKGENGGAVGAGALALKWAKENTNSMWRNVPQQTPVRAQSSQLPHSWARYLKTEQKKSLKALSQCLQFWGAFPTLKHPKVYWWTFCTRAVSASQTWKLNHKCTALALGEEIPPEKWKDATQSCSVPSALFHMETGAHLSITPSAWLHKGQVRVISALRSFHCIAS